MFGHKHYVPILKGKRGDLWALRHLKPGSREVITPVIEIVPPSEKKTEAQGLDAIVAGIEKSWGIPSLFVDLLWRDGIPNIAHNSHVVDAFFQRARARNIAAIPVTSPVRTPAYQQAVQRVVQQDKRGVAIRLSPEMFDDAKRLAHALTALMNLLGVARKDVDIILDFGSVTATATGLLSLSMGQALASLASIASWRTITIASGSFPASIASLAQNNWTKFPRKEWQAWRQVVASLAAGARMPSYGDYAVGDPDLPYSGYANFTANLRYSHGTDFMVWRGQAVKTHPQGNGQMHGICQSLIARPEFAGVAFSQGDAEIHVRATTQGSPGGLNEWRQWATNHYLELVADQISNLP